MTSAVLRGPTTSSGAGHRSPGIRYVPALDGLRGLAVVAVLCFHGGFAWAGGGYLGVSAFFTLSGYLITSLLVAEHAARGGIRLGDFWARRVRRLLPAALATLAAVALYGWAFAPDLQRVNLRGDLLGALFYVANWRFLIRGESYAEIQSEPGLVTHFWSLGIEEQVYVLWPLLAVAALAWAGRKGLLGVAAAVTAGAVVCSIVLWDVVGTSTDAVYYGTETRVAEVMVGAMLALLVPMSGDPLRGRGAGRRLAPFGAVALVAVLVLWTRTDQPDAWQYRGGFALHAVLVAVVIAGAVRPGPLATALGWRPLRAVGLVSYGLYLYHWPVFLIVDEDRLDVGRGPLFAVRVLVTVAVAVASYFLLEQPVRRGRVLAGRRIWPAALAGMAVVAVLIVATNRSEPAVAFGDVDPSQGEITVVTAPSAEPSSEAPEAIMTIGDSGMYDATPGLRASFLAAGTRTSVETAFPGIGLTNDARDWRTEWSEAVREHDPDLVLVMLGGFDLEFLEQEGPERYLEVVDEAVRTLSAEGGRVVWLSILPCGQQPDEELNRLFATLPQRHPGTVTYLDTAAAFPGCPTSFTAEDGSTVPLRKPDGWHLCPDGAARFAQYVHEQVAAMGWAPPPVDGWELGDWRGEARYDDPPGGCDVVR